MTCMVAAYSFYVNSETTRWIIFQGIWLVLSEDLLLEELSVVVEWCCIPFEKKWWNVDFLGICVERKETYKQKNNIEKERKW